MLANKEDRHVPALLPGPVIASPEALHFNLITQTRKRI